MIWWLALFAAIICALILTRPLLPAKTRDAKMMVTAFMLLFVGAVLGTYKLIGAPEMSDPAHHQLQHPTATPPDVIAMVEGLAERLKSDPDNPDGWARLIRSRIVLGDIQGAIRDHKTMREVFADNPEMISQISDQSGFTALAQSALEQSQTTDE